MNEKMKNKTDRTDEQMNLLSCKFCGKHYRTKTLLSKHESRHSLQNINTHDKSDQLKKYQCKICGQKFRFTKALVKHEERHQGDGGFKCRSCGLTFTSSELREKHREKEHKVMRCRICNIRFELESQYLHHINSLHDGRDRELSICSECGKQFKTKGELNHHVSSKCGTVKKYECSICQQSLMTAGSLHNHMLRHNGERTYMCRFCAKTVLTAGQLTVHERMHTQEKVFVCEICRKGFCHRQSLITHSSLHTGIKPYQCEGCGQSFSCVGNLLKHRKTHADICGKLPLTTHRVKNPATKLKVQANTPLASKLRTMEKRKRMEAVVQQINSSVDENEHQSESDKNSPEIMKSSTMTLEMNLCIKKEDTWTPKITSNSSEESSNDNDRQQYDNNVENFNIYEETDANEDSIKEENSHDNDDFWNKDDTFSDSESNNSLDTLPNHNASNSKCNKVNNKKRNKNRILCKKILEERGDKLNCKNCGSCYTNVGWLVRHEMKCSTGPTTKGYKCSCCNNNFKTKEECLNHQQLKHADILTCKECDRIFANPDSMKAHINFKHKGIPRKVYVYVCEKCGKRFKQKALLLNHEKSNCGTEGSLYQCNICSKSFTSKHVCKSHMRVHLPEKSLLCKFCGKSFHWKGQLKIHERSHTGEKPFKCEYCPKAFSYRESLITHTTLHTGIKPHLCGTCGSRFSCIGNLLKHRRTHASTCGQISFPKLENNSLS